MRKEDRRSTYTEKVIQDALFGLLEKKPIERITVTEVCKTAGINRSTFYLHYMDCMDVLEKEQEKLCDKLIAAMEHSRKDPEGGKAMDLIEELNRLTREDHKVYLLLMRSGQPMKAFPKFADYCRNFLSEEIRQRSALSESQCGLVADYIIAGSFAISLSFAEEKTYDPDREKIFHILTAGGIDALIRNYTRE